MLKLSGIEAGYGESMILRGLDLAVPAGQVVCLMGRNGVGKTTLMRCIMGLLRPRKGTVAFHDRDLTAALPEQRARAGIGCVPQGREIFPQLTVGENLLLGLEARSDGSRELPEAALALFPALRGMLHRKGGDLSGGQQQQLAIARALVSEPKLLLLDEPMEGIQPSIVMEIESVIESIKQSKEMGVLLVEQSLTFATAVADYYYVLDKGTIVDEGTAAELDEEKVRRHLVV